MRPDQFEQASGSYEGLRQENPQKSEITTTPHPGAWDQQIILERMSNLCLQKITSETTRNNSFCPIAWDGIYCWPSIPAGTIHNIPCPSYVFGFDSTAFATRYCTPSGTWWKREDTNATWTNYTRCVVLPPTVGILDETLELQPHVDSIRLISKVGYSLSLVTLLVAFLILAFVRRLRCPRNNLHMQLFMSFILRSLMFLLKDSLFPNGVTLHTNTTTNDATMNFKDPMANLDCKVLTSFWHYFLMANYCWILMEGVYLHNLVFLAMFTDNSSIFRYLLAGWGLPILFIIPWIVVRATTEDTFCWTTNEQPSNFWIIRGPITASILINFVFFINITRVLFVKMFASQTAQTKHYRYRKWFRSTLVLVPLFGVHYAILLSMSLAAEVNSTVEIIWLYIDQSFSSSQGLFVALLYCFLNGEVQTELKKLWQRKMAAQEIRSHHSLLSHSLTSYVSRGRSSVQSFHSTSVIDKKDTLRCISPATPDLHKIQNAVNSRITVKRFPPFGSNPCFSAEDPRSEEHSLIDMASQLPHASNGLVKSRLSSSQPDVVEERNGLTYATDAREHESNV